MSLALDTVPGTTEPDGWTRVHGNLYLTGNTRRGRTGVSADAQPAARLRARDAGLARVAAAVATSGAIELLSAAANACRFPNTSSRLAMSTQSPATRRRNERVLSDAAATANGVTMDLELALFAADHPDYAMARPRTRSSRRHGPRLPSPPSIYGHDTLAWALYRAGDTDAAWEEIQQALRLGTRDALLHYHAGMIADARGDTAAARTHSKRHSPSTRTSRFCTQPKHARRWRQFTNDASRLPRRRIAARG